MIMSEPKSSFRPLLWAATLAVGFGTVWAIVGAWLYAGIDSVRQGSEGNTYEQLVIRSDGTPLIHSYRFDDPSLSTYHDLSGRVQDPPDGTNVLQGVYMPGGEGRPGIFADRLPWQQRLKVFVNEQEPVVSWYFVHDGKQEGAGYLVGYERESNRRGGFIGMQGFRSDPVPIDDWIPVRSALMADYSQWSSAPISIYWGSTRLGPRALRPGQRDLPPHLVFIPSGNRIQLVDLSTRSVKTVFQASAPIEALGVPPLSTSSKEQPILVRAGQQIQTLDHNYKTTRAFTIPNEVDRSDRGVTWYEIDNGQAIAITPRTVYRIAVDGTIQDQVEYNLKTGSRALSQEMGAFLFALALPSPALVIAIEPLLLMGIDPALSYPGAMSALVKSSWPSLLMIFALSLVLALMAKRRSRAFGLANREQFAWTVFVLFLGLPAYVGFRLHRRWPIREACPHCNARVPRDRTACAECGTRFPDPALKGIEIFA